MTKAQELLPCPFCGSPGAMCCLEDEPGSPASFWVNCSCGIETRERRTEAEAIDLWNTRAQPESPAGNLDVAQEARNLRGALRYMEETNARMFEPAHVVALIALVVGRLGKAAALSDTRPLHNSQEK